MFAKRLIETFLFKKIENLDLFNNWYNLLFYLKVYIIYFNLHTIKLFMGFGIDFFL
jgi:hypothetical protein